MKLPDIHFAMTPFEIGMVVPLSNEVRNSFVKFSPGSKVTILSFTPTSRGFVNNNGMLPGIYENFRWLKVRGEDGRTETVPEHFLDSTGLERRSRQRAKIADLPTLPFCEDDTVIALGGRYCKIVSIDYEAVWMQQNGDTEVLSKRASTQFYTVCATDGGLHREAAENEMKLVKRGMVQAFYAGHALDFDNPEEEAKFYARIGQADAIVNQTSGTRAFSRDEAIAALENGDADVVFSVTNHFQPLTEGDSYHLRKFRDEAVGARIREAYMTTLEMAGPKFS